MKKESVNIDKDFREKLALREISPSPQAWDRLDAMLNVAEQTQKKTTPTNLWYVAAAVLLLALALVMLFKTAEPRVEFVEVPVEVPSVEQSEPVDAVIEVTPEPVRRMPSAPAEKRRPVVNQQVAQNVPIEIAPEPTIVEETLLTPVVAVPKQRKKIKIDPKALLSEVDAELERTFRERALKAIDEKFRRGKSAWVNRNVE
jgi:hypothetical protein